MTAHRVTMFPVYRPDGGPYYWRDEQSGVMQMAVMLFLSERGEMNPLQVEILRQYFQHWIDCPIWDANSDQDVERMNFLRFDIQTISDTARLHAWYRTAVDVGIDPL